MVPGSPKPISPASKGRMEPSCPTRFPLLSMSTCVIISMNRWQEIYIYIYIYISWLSLLRTIFSTTLGVFVTISRSFLFSPRAAASWSRTDCTSLEFFLLPNPDLYLHCWWRKLPNDRGKIGGEAGRGERETLATSSSVVSHCPPPTVDPIGDVILNHQCLYSLYLISQGDWGVAVITFANWRFTGR